MRKTAILLLVLLLPAPALLGREQAPYVFSGNRRYSDADLVEVAPDAFEHYRRLSDRTAAETAAEDAAWEIGRFYEDEGYPYSSVEVRFTDEGAAYLIREGPRVFLGDVTVDDPSGEVLAEFVKPPRSWFLGPRLYVQDSLETAARNMTSWLRQRGYLDAVVTPPARLEYSFDRDWPDEMTIPVRYEVERGPRYVLKKIRLSGFPGFRADLVELLSPREGLPYTPFSPFDIQGSVAEFLGNRGYPFAKVDLTEHRTPVGDKVEIVVDAEIDSGPQVVIGPIRIHGNLRVEDAAIRRELRLAPGDQYIGKRLFESQQRVFSTNLFSQVNAHLAREAEEGAGGGPIAEPIDVRVEDVDYRHLDTSIGFGSWELIRGSVGMTWTNLDGYGRGASTSLSSSIRGFEARAGASEPWLFGIEHLKGSLDGVAEQQERPTYSYNRLALSATLTKNVAYKLIASLRYSLGRTDVTSVSGEIPAEFENQTNISSITFGLTREARDSPWDPTQGSLLAGSLEVADPIFGSDLAFLRARFRAIQILSLSASEPRFVVVGLAELGAISPRGKTTDIPIQERFFLGGGQTVRSFAEDDLGPRLVSVENGTPTTTTSPSGGEFMSRVSVEFRIPLFGDLEGAVFGDGGNVIQKVRDAGIDGYRFAVGAGLRYRTPLGPIRLDFGVNPSPKRYEDRWHLFFAIGYPF